MSKTCNQAYLRHKKVGGYKKIAKFGLSLGRGKYLSVKIEKQRTLCYTLYLH